MRFKQKPERPKTPTPWGNAVSAVLKAGSIDQASVAARVHVSRQHLSNCLVGNRAVTENTALQINAAVAELVGEPSLRDYLDLEAALSDIGPDDASDTRAAPAVRCLQWYAEFFAPGSIETVVERIESLEKARKRKVVAALNRAYRKIALFEIMPSSQFAGFQDVYDALASGGFNVEKLISTDCKEQLAHERFAQFVLLKLAAENPKAKPGHRLAVLREILGATAGLAFEIKADGASNGREIVTFEGGKRFSRFDGDPESVWGAFTEPARIGANDVTDRATGATERES